MCYCIPFFFLLKGDEARSGNSENLVTFVEIKRKLVAFVEIKKNNCGIYASKENSGGIQNPNYFAIK